LTVTGALSIDIFVQQNTFLTVGSNTLLTPTGALDAIPVANTMLSSLHTFGVAGVDSVEAVESDCAHAAKLKKTSPRRLMRKGLFIKTPWVKGDGVTPLLFQCFNI
jgi:hypothetical protein